MHRPEKKTLDEGKPRRPSEKEDRSEDMVEKINDDKTSIDPTTRISEVFGLQGAGGEMPGLSIIPGRGKENQKTLATSRKIYIPKWRRLEQELIRPLPFVEPSPIQRKTDTQQDKAPKKPQPDETYPQQEHVNPEPDIIIKAPIDVITDEVPVLTGNSTPVLIKIGEKRDITYPDRRTEKIQITKYYKKD